MGDCALHTVIGRNSRRRKGLEPSRRLSETAGPRPSGAFRIAFLTAEVTNHRAACKPAVPVSTHRAPALPRYRRAPGAGHTLPQTVAGSCTRYRSLVRAGAMPGVQGDSGSVDSLPRTHRDVVFSLPLITVGSHAPHSAGHRRESVERGGESISGRGAERASRRGRHSRRRMYAPGARALRDVSRYGTHGPEAGSRSA